MSTIDQRLERLLAKRERERDRAEQERLKPAPLPPAPPPVYTFEARLSIARAYNWQVGTRVLIGPKFGAFIICGTDQWERPAETIGEIDMVTPDAIRMHLETCSKHVFAWVYPEDFVHLRRV